jgi:hypothetical protein
LQFGAADQYAQSRASGAAVVQFAHLFLLALALLVHPAQASEFKRIDAFGRVSVGAPAEWPCGPGEEGALVCREPRGLATLSIQLLESRHEKPLSEAEARLVAGRAARLLAEGDGERFGSPYYGWETIDGGALEGGRTARRDGQPVRIFDWALFVARPEALTRVTVQLVAHEEFFDASDGAQLVTELGGQILPAVVR